MPDALIAAVEAIYQAAPDPSLWPNALQAIADVFHDVGTVLLHQRDDGKLVTIVSESLTEAQADYDKTWWRHDVRSARALERGYTSSGDVITDRDVVLPHEMREHPIYTDFLIPRGLGQFAGIGVSPDPNVQVWISIQRRHDKGPFTERELARVLMLGRQVETSMRLSIRLLDSESKEHGLGEVLSSLSIGVIGLDAIGRVSFRNRAFERLPGGFVKIVKDRLHFAAAADRSAVASMCERAGDALVGVDTAKPVVLARSGDSGSITVYALPIAAGAAGTSGFLTSTKTLLILIDRASEQLPDASLVRDILGLTLGEARVAALVGSGLPPREAAARLGIAEDTARTALKRVFAKVGISRQSELTALLTRLVLR